MTQEHVELLSLRPAARRRAGVRPSRGAERHIVVATQDLPRMSSAIQELMAAGYMVTAYASPTRLLPRLHRWGTHPVALLVIDGGASPAFARAAAIAARSTYPQLPIVLLAGAAAAQNAEFMPSGVTLLRLPLADGALMATAARLLPPEPAPWNDTPPDAA
jgi:hypothetical protein